jgi:hypothetical protein
VLQHNINTLFCFCLFSQKSLKTFSLLVFAVVVYPSIPLSNTFIPVVDMDAYIEPLEDLREGRQTNMADVVVDFLVERLFQLLVEKGKAA